MPPSEIDLWHMRRALELAIQGQGVVEPNPMVGCVVARGAEIIGEGWHRRFGGDHAEVEALRLAGDRARGATLYVTLEPCCHHGKTPPCTRAVLAAGVRRVVAAMRDPFRGTVPIFAETTQGSAKMGLSPLPPEAAGGGLAELRAAGVEVETGLLEDEARRLNAPYLKLLGTGRPWVIAKWAMTLDGKIATRTGESRWISNEQSRQVVHALRGRVDAILVGRGTAERDDPLLTARPPGPRTATRIVLDSRASLASESQLVRTARETPLLIAAGPEASEADRQRLVAAGCEVIAFARDPSARPHPNPLPKGEGTVLLDALLAELGRRRMTNVLVEGGARLLGGLLDARAIDEVHAFIAPKLVGGAGAPSPIAGLGVDAMPAALRLEQVETQRLGDDVYLRGRISQ